MLFEAKWLKYALLNSSEENLSTIVGTTTKATYTTVPKNTKLNNSNIEITSFYHPYKNKDGLFSKIL